MLSLKPFKEDQFLKDNPILIDADFQIISADTIELMFKWQDKSEIILFSENQNSGRLHELWKNTCFEAFFKISTTSSANGTGVGIMEKKYFEINLNISGAWNVYEFQDYRTPQPPAECLDAEVTDFHKGENFLKCKIKIKSKEIKKANVSLCAVLNLKEVGITYWSFKHADTKPNFHHFDSFVIERNF